MARLHAAAAVFLLALFVGWVQAKTIPINWTFGTAKRPIVQAKCGDVLSFTVTGFHDITQIKLPATCTANVSKVWAAAPAPSPFNVPLRLVGRTFYKCSIGNHCSAGFMLMTVNTTGPCPSPPPPKPKPSPPKPKPKPPSPKPKPAPKTIPVTWTFGTAPLAPITANCGDSIQFNTNGFHSIIKISAASCTAPVIGAPIAAAPAPTTTLVKLTAAGKTFYKCDVGGGSHCSAGFMLLTVNTGAC